MSDQHIYEQRTAAQAWPALAELAEARKRLNDAIQACTELGMDYAAVVVAKDRAERERDRLTRILEMSESATKASLGQAISLLEYAFLLRQYGDTPRKIGRKRTWAEFDQSAAAFLRAIPSYRPVQVPENAGKHLAESGDNGSYIDIRQALISPDGRGKP